MNIQDRVIEYFLFIIGGGIGILINILITITITDSGIDFGYAYTLGTFCNIIFNFLYHKVITFGLSQNLRRKFVEFSSLSVILWVLNIFLANMLESFLSMHYYIATVISAFFLSIGNYLISSTYIFSSSIDPKELEIEKLYGEVEFDFYDVQQVSINPIRSWFHQTRQKKIEETVMSYIKGITNPKIVDLGCGNCSWNSNGFSVLGIDLNEDLLKHAKSLNRLTSYTVAPTDNTGLPDNFADVVVISEVIEHLIHPEPTLREINRILKSTGIVIVTVPYDTKLSLWKPLFTIQCFIQGHIKRSQYYLNKCGHVYEYSPSSISKLLSSRFKILEQFNIRRFSIFTICTKPDHNYSV